MCDHVSPSPGALTAEGGGPTSPSLLTSAERATSGDPERATGGQNGLQVTGVLCVHRETPRDVRDYRKAPWFATGPLRTQPVQFATRGRNSLTMRAVWIEGQFTRIGGRGREIFWFGVTFLQFRRHVLV